MNKTMKRLLLTLSSLAIIALGAFVVLLPTASAPTQSYGAANVTQLIGGFPYFLAGSGISSSATSITLTSLTLPQTGYEIVTADLGSPFYLTLEPGNTTRQEFISCTTVTQSPSNATAVLSGCTRGLLPISPYTNSSSYQFSHSGGTTAIFSNSPQFYQQFYQLGNVATSTNTLIFSATTPPQYDVGVTASGLQLVDAAQLNATAFLGAATATESTLGLTRLVTAAQVGVGTASSTSGAPLVLLNKYATSTPGALCTSSWSCIVVTTAGKIAQGFLDWTQNIAFSGNNTHAGTETFNNTATFNSTTNFTGGITGADWQLVVATTTKQATILLQATTTTAYKRYMIFINIYGSSSLDVPVLNFNNDYTNNYGFSSQSASPTGGSVLVTGGSGQASCNAFVYSTTTQSLSGYIYNPTTTRKLMNFTDLSASTTGAMAPQSITTNCVWNNTTAQITNFELNYAFDGTTFNASTTMTIYGSNSGN